MAWRRTQTDLPSDIMTNILIRLPIKSIMQCLSVCKYWYSIIKHPSFVNTHFLSHHNYHLNSSTKYLIFLHDTRIVVRRDDKSLSVCYTLKVPRAENHTINIHGSCNGLVCFSSWTSPSLRTTYLWNPTIRKLKTLPQCLEKPNNDELLLGFGFHQEADNDYLVVKIPCRDTTNNVRIEVYSLKTNSWRRIHNRIPAGWINRDDQLVVVRGTMYYWLSHNHDHDINQTVICFDVVNETFREIALPQSVLLDEIHLVVFGGVSLIVFGLKAPYWRGYFECMWLYDDDGEKGDWKMMLRIDRNSDDNGIPVGFINNCTEILVDGFESYLTYNIVSGEVKKFRNSASLSRDPNQVQPFVETLAILSDGHYY